MVSFAVILGAQMNANGDESREHVFASLIRDIWIIYTYISTKGSINYTPIVEKKRTKASQAIIVFSCAPHLLLDLNEWRGAGFEPTVFSTLYHDRKIMKLSAGPRVK